MQYILTDKEYKALKIKADLYEPLSKKETVAYVYSYFSAFGGEHFDLHIFNESEIITGLQANLKESRDQFFEARKKIIEMEELLKEKNKKKSFFK